MNVLVACEFSGIVRETFLRHVAEKRGEEAAGRLRRDAL